MNLIVAAAVATALLALSGGRPPEAIVAEEVEAAASTPPPVAPISAPLSAPSTALPSAPSAVPPSDPTRTSSGGFPDLTSYGIPFTHTWPNLPNVASVSAVVSDGRCGTLQRAIKRPRTKISVTAGDYGTQEQPCNLTFRQVDQWVDVSNGSTITGTVVFDGHRGQARTRVTGGIWRGERWQGNGLVDVTIDNVNGLVDTGFGWGVANGVTRLAILNSTFEAVRGVAMFTSPGRYADQRAKRPEKIYRNDDITVHNSRLRAGVWTKPGEAVLRCQSCNRLVVIGNLMQTINNGKHTFRIHGRSSEIFAAYNQLENPINSNQFMIRTSAGRGNQYGDIKNVYLLNNRLYSEKPLRGYGSQASIAGNDEDGTGRGNFDVIGVVVTGNRSFIKSNAKKPFYVGAGAPPPARAPVDLMESENVATEFAGYPENEAGADH